MPHVCAIVCHDAAFPVHRTAIEDPCRTHLPEVRLDFDLSPELMFHTFLLHLGFKEHLQGHDNLQLLFSSQVHIPKLALSQWPTNIEVLN